MLQIIYIYIANFAAFYSFSAIPFSLFYASKSEAISLCCECGEVRRIAAVGWRLTRALARWPAGRPSNTSSTGASSPAGISLLAIRKQPPMLSWPTLTNCAYVAIRIVCQKKHLSLQETIAEYQVKQKKKFMLVLCSFFNSLPFCFLLLESV